MGGPDLSDAVNASPQPPEAAARHHGRRQSIRLATGDESIQQNVDTVLEENRFKVV